MTDSQPNTFDNWVALPLMTASRNGLRRGALIALTLVLSAAPAGAYAQGDIPSEQGGGLLLTPKAKLDTIPKAPVYRDSLPENADLSSLLPTPGNQGSQGSCVAWAVGYAARAYYSAKFEKGDPNDDTHIPSPAYIYSRAKEPGSCRSAGTYIAKALDLLVKDGSLSLDEFPYRQESCDPPSGDARQDETGFRIDGYNRLDDRSIIENIKGELAKGNPVIMAIKTTAAFHQLKAGQVYNTPTECLAADGNCNHAVTAVGYDERRQAVRLMNSWGTKWATDGFAWIDYNTLRNQILEAYVMRVSPPPSPPICSLTSNASVIFRGQSVTLNYASDSATKVVFDNGIGEEVGSAARLGEKTVAPIYTTAYTATFSGHGGRSVCSTSVVVQDQQSENHKPDISSFTASPNSIVTGRETTLAWAVSGAQSIRIEPDIGVVKGTSLHVSPSKSMMYKMIATNAWGTTSASTAVTVTSPTQVDLPSVECGKLYLRDQDGQQIVGGFVKKADDLDSVRSAFPNAKVDVQVRPFPQCEALLTLDRAMHDSGALTVSIRKSPDGSLVEASPFVIEIKTPAYPSYIHIAYVQADGAVRNLSQVGDGGSIIAYPPNSKIIIGDGEGNHRRFLVSGPFGQEMIIVTAGRSPLFAEPRPKTETEREFLSALRRALLFKPDPRTPDRDIVAAIDTVLTKSKAMR